MAGKTTEIKKIPFDTSGNSFSRTNSSARSSRANVPLNQDNNTFTNLIDRWMDYCRAAGLAYRTMVDYADKAGKFWWWWNEHTGYAKTRGVHPRFVTTLEAREFVSYLRGPAEHRWGIKHHNRQTEYLSPTSVKSYGRSIKVFFNWLEQEGHIEHSPFNRSVKFSNRHKQDKVIKTVQPEDLAKIFKVLTDPAKLKTYEGIRNLAIVALLLDSGIRRGELLSMRLKDLNLEGDRTTITGKTGRRWAMFSDICRNALTDYLQLFRRRQNSDPSSPFWLCRDGEPLSYYGFGTVIRKLSDASGVEFYAHKLRHTFASLMARQGTNVYDLKALLGHSSITTTQVYIHDDVEHLSKVHAPNSPLNFLVQSQVKGIETPRRRRGRPRMQR